MPIPKPNISSNKLNFFYGFSYAKALIYEYGIVCFIKYQLRRPKQPDHPHIARIKFYLLLKRANVAKDLDIREVLFHKIYELAANLAARKDVAGHDKNAKANIR